MNQTCPKSRKEKLRVKLKTLQVQLAHLSQIYDSHVTIESNIQPFVKLQWAMGKRMKKKLPPTPTSVEGFKNSLKKRAGTIAPCFREMAKVADIFFYFFCDLSCQQMENVSIIYADGTFKIVPKNFTSC